MIDQHKSDLKSILKAHGQPDEIAQLFLNNAMIHVSDLGIWSFMANGGELLGIVHGTVSSETVGERTAYTNLGNFKCRAMKSNGETRWYRTGGKRKFLS
jgi:hypothetical protein